MGPVGPWCVPSGHDPDVDARVAICDKDYASKANRQAARDRGAIPVVPHKANENENPAFFANVLYKGAVVASVAFAPCAILVP